MPKSLPHGGYRRAGITVLSLIVACARVARCLLMDAVAVVTTEKGFDALDQAPIVLSTRYDMLLLGMLALVIMAFASTGSVIGRREVSSNWRALMMFVRSLTH